MQVTNDTNSISLGGPSCGSTSFGGNLQIQYETRSSLISVAYTAVKGNVQVSNNAGAVVVQYDSSGGNMEIQSNTNTLVSSYNMVNGNLQIQNNTGTSSQVVGNTVTASLQCSGNTNISGSGNMAASKQGQCVNF
jgi:hypothetical protein